MKYSDQLKDRRWKLKAEKIRKRDGYKCRVCGCNGNGNPLEVHHLYYEGLAWEVDDDGLITLCVEHHEAIHDLKKIAGIIAFDMIKKEYDATDRMDGISTIKDHHYTLMRFYISDNFRQRTIQKHFNDKKVDYLEYFDEDYKDHVDRLKSDLEMRYNIKLY